MELMKRLESIEKERRSDEAAMNEKEYVRHMKEKVMHDQAAQQQMKTWDQMRQRLDHFEKTLTEDRGDAAGGPSIPTPPKEGADGVPAPKPSPDGVPADRQVEMAALVRKLQKQAKPPQETFVEALEDIQDEDKEFWAANFPPGYRERIAPQFLGEIYSKQKTAKQWAKDWVKDRQLGEHPEAREIIPACAAVDAIFLTDRMPGAINQVTTENLARKIMGIHTAFKDVWKESDWKKQSAKNWKTKIDREIWKRWDPHIEDSEHVFLNRKAENEVRTEMDRDAAMLKARNKLQTADAK